MLDTCCNCCCNIDGIATPKRLMQCIAFVLSRACSLPDRRLATAIAVQSTQTLATEFRGNPNLGELATVSVPLRRI